MKYNYLYEEASKNNPFKLEPKFIIPTIISFGDDEPELWISTKH